MRRKEEKEDEEEKGLGSSWAATIRSGPVSLSRSIKGQRSHVQIGETSRLFYLPILQRRLLTPRPTNATATSAKVKREIRLFGLGGGFELSPLSLAS